MLNVEHDYEVNIMSTETTQENLAKVPAAQKPSKKTKTTKKPTADKIVAGGLAQREKDLLAREKALKKKELAADAAIAKMAVIEKLALRKQTGEMTRYNVSLREYYSEKIQIDVNLFNDNKTNTNFKGATKIAEIVMAYYDGKEL